MKKTNLFWILAIVITLISAFYQRVTGPTYPLSEKINFDGKEISYKLERSQETVKNYLVEIETGDEAISGTLFWRKFNSGNDFTAIPMTGSKKLIAELPVQQRLEKLDYYIQLSKSNKTVILPKEKIITLRFKDPVPIYIL